MPGKILYFEVYFDINQRSVFLSVYIVYLRMFVDCNRTQIA